MVGERGDYESIRRPGRNAVAESRAERPRFEQCGLQSGLESIRVDLPALTVSVCAREVICRSRVVLVCREQLLLSGRCEVEMDRSRVGLVNRVSRMATGREEGGLKEPVVRGGRAPKHQGNRFRGGPLRWGQLGPLGATWAARP